MKDLTAFTDMGSSHCSTALSLVGSMHTSPSLTTNPKYSTSVLVKGTLGQLEMEIFFLHPVEYSLSPFLTFFQCFSKY